MEETSGRIDFMHGSIFQTGLLVDVVQSASDMLDKAGRQLKVGEEPFEIRGVKAAHLNWLGLLGNVVHGRSDLSESEVNSGHECAFGKWYDNEGTACFGDSRLFRGVGRIHMQLHESGKESIRLANEGKADAAKRTMGKMHTMAKELFEQLDLLYVDEESRRAAS